MRKKIIALVSLLIILTFIGYIVYDTIRSGSKPQSKESEKPEPVIPDKWFVFNSMAVAEGKLDAVAVSAKGDILAGGESFVSCYTPLQNCKSKSTATGRLCSKARLHAKATVSSASAGEGETSPRAGPTTTSSAIRSSTTSRPGICRRSTPSGSKGRAWTPLRPWGPRLFPSRP